MKKRNLLLALMMAFVMLFTACGTVEKPNPFVGKWNGTLDLTEHFVQSMVSENASLKKYAKFENLTFTYVFEFTEDQVSLHVDEASTKQFIENTKTGVTNMVDAMAADLATENNMTVEDIYAGMNMTREAFIQATIDLMKLDTMVSSMVESLELSGSYQSDSESIIVFYEDDTYEEMKYSFNGDKLSITVSDGTNNFVINCTKTK